MNSLVELVGLGRRYAGPAPLVALEGVDLVIGASEMLAIVGPSGSGKSTLLNILGLLDVPTSGRYTLGGTDTTDIDEHTRAGLRSTMFGFVFQAFHLVPERTVVQNICLPLVYRGVGRRARRERAEELASAVGLDHRLEAEARTLSGGERQRVAIARALVGDPALLLCDEPTGNLDSTATTAVFELLAVCRDRGTTVVVVTHDEHLARRADRVVRIVDGRLSPRR